jgi:hypothetical protein
METHFHPSSYDAWSHLIPKLQTGFRTESSPSSRQDLPLDLSSSSSFLGWSRWELGRQEKEAEWDVLV